MPPRAGRAVGHFDTLRAYPRESSSEISIIFARTRVVGTVVATLRIYRYPFIDMLLPNPRSKLRANIRSYAIDNLESIIFERVPLPHVARRALEHEEPPFHIRDKFWKKYHVFG